MYLSSCYYQIANSVATSKRPQEAAHLFTARPLIRILEFVHLFRVWKARHTPAFYTVSDMKSGIARQCPAAGRGIAVPSCWNAHLGRFYKQRCVHTSATPQGITHFGFANDFDRLYEVTDYLGSGSFGSVHVCVEKATGESFAVKTVGKKKLGAYLEPHFMRRVQHEVDMFNHMGRSLNVVHLKGVYENNKCVDLVMQLCSGGELWKRIKLGAYGERQAARLIREVLRAVAQCHARGVVIRDVKPENFLFLDDSDDSPLKMIDFGIAEYCTEGQELDDRAGTPIYCAPEVLRKRYGLKADVWSTGIIAYQLLTARLPFESDNGGHLAENLHLSHAQLTNREIFSAILYAPMDFTSPPWDTISDGAKNLVQQLLERDPALRPSAAEALEHPWLRAATAPTTANGRTNSNGCSNTDNTSSSSSSSLSHGDEPQPLSIIIPPTPTLDDSLVQRLQRYGTYAKLKRLCLSKVASFMTDYDSKALAQLRDALGNVSVDTPRNTTSYKIPYHKMVEVLKSGQWQLSEVEVRQLLSSFSIDADGCMDASEWLAALTEWKEVQQTPEWEELVSQAFSAIDQDGSGQLSMHELESLLCGENECSIEDTVPAALREAQADVDVACASTDWENMGPGELSGCETGGRRGKNGKSVPQLVLDRPAFARLLQMAKQDRLELFESRWERRRRSVSRGPGGREEDVTEQVETGREEQPAGDLVAH